MSYFDTYQEHLTNIGATGHDREVNLIHRDFARLAPMSAAYKNILIGDVQRKAVVKSGENYYTKEFLTPSDEPILVGSIITFATKKWFVKEYDFDNELYCKCRAYMCNATMRWKDKNGVSHTYYGYADDATKYSEGTEGNKNLRVGEFQIKVLLGLDQNTVLINRDMRFLIDSDIYVSDIVANEDAPYAFKVSRRNVVTGTYGDDGYIEITLVEDSFIDGKDNIETMIAAQPWELNPSGAQSQSSTSESRWL